MVLGDVNAGGGSGNASMSATGSEPIQWLHHIMNPLNASFLSEPAWKWAMFVIAMSLFLAAWSGVIRYMK